MALTLKPKYGYCHLSNLIHLPVPCINTSRPLILPELYLYMGSEPSKSPRLTTVKAVHSPYCCKYGPIPVLARIWYPIFRERTNSFKRGRGVVLPGGYPECS